jgi:hypothetical protein
MEVKGIVDFPFLYSMYDERANRYIVYNTENVLLHASFRSEIEAEDYIRDEMFELKLQIKFTINEIKLKQHSGQYIAKE